MSETHYERLGGLPALRAIVARFYKKMQQAPAVARHFSGVNVARLVDHQTHFMVSLLGGPGAHTDEMIRTAHVGLNISDGEFTLMLLILRETLEEAGLEPGDVGLIVGEMRKRADLVVEAA